MGLVDCYLSEIESSHFTLYPSLGIARNQIPADMPLAHIKPYPLRAHSSIDLLIDYARQTTSALDSGLDAYLLQPHLRRRAGISSNETALTLSLND